MSRKTEKIKRRKPILKRTFTLLSLNPPSHTKQPCYPWYLRVRKIVHRLGNILFQRHRSIPFPLVLRYSALPTKKPPLPIPDPFGTLSCHPCHAIPSHLSATDSSTMDSRSLRWQFPSPSPHLSNLRFSPAPPPLASAVSPPVLEVGD